MAQFQALQVAFELVEALGRVVPLIRAHDRELAEQLRTAGSSVVSCIAEGAQRVGKDRLQLYRISGGSASEVNVQLRIAVAWRYVAADVAAPAIQLADRMVRITWGLTHPRS